MKKNSRNRSLEVNTPKHPAHKEQHIEEEFLRPVLQPPGYKYSAEQDDGGKQHHGHADPVNPETQVDAGRLDPGISKMNCIQTIALS